MTFDENETMNPDGTNISASQAKKMQNEIDALKETVSTLADAVTDFASETDTAQLRANKAAIVDADIANVEIEKAVVTDAEIGLLDATQGSIKTLESESIEADEADITDIDARTVTANSVNSASYTGVLVNVQGVKSNSGEIKAVTSQTTETDELTVNSDAEIKGALTQRGNINFPENGDIIQGEYVEFWGRNAKIKNLITQTPQDSTQLVGYDNNGNLIPVDGTLDPGNFWRNKEGEPGTIETKDDKGIDVADIACDDLTAEGDITVTGNITATGDVSCDNASVATDVTVGGDVTVSGDVTVNGEVSDILVNGTLQVNGDIIQNGSAYETHAEKLYTKNDMIITRDGAVGSLATGEYTGIQAEKYDGTNDGQLVFDKDGEARVGDVGDTEPLLTRDEKANMTDGRPLIWDDTNERAVCGSSSQADALNSGITASDVTQILENETAIGDLSALTTTDKTDLVSAINEVVGSISNPDVSSATGTLAIAHGGTGATSADAANVNLGEAHLYITESAASLSSATKTFTVTTPAGTDNLPVGSVVKVCFTSACQSSVAMTSVSLSYGGRTGYIMAAKGGAMEGLHSHEFTGGNYSSSYPHKVWDAYTTLELMWDGTVWLVMGNPVVCTYDDGSGNGYNVFANGYIEQWGNFTGDGWRTVNLYISYSDTNYTVLGTVDSGDRLGDSVFHMNKASDNFTTSTMYVSTFRARGANWQTTGY